MRAVDTNVLVRPVTRDEVFQSSTELKGCSFKGPLIDLLNRTRFAPANVSPRNSKPAGLIRRLERSTRSLLFRA
jgi:hypothetical protein